MENKLWGGNSTVSESEASSRRSEHRSHGEPPAAPRLMSPLLGWERLIRPSSPLGSSIPLLRLSLDGTQGGRIFRDGGGEESYGRPPLSDKLRVRGEEWAGRAGEEF